MKRVLISGASGFVGSNVLTYLLDNTDWDFTVISSWKHKGSPLNVPNDPRVEVVSHDLTGPIPDIGTFDIIYNLASESHVDRSIADPVNFIENNVAVCLSMLEYARKHPPKAFVHFSTDEVYGALRHDDWDVLLPSNPYSASKAAQEMFCIAYWKTYKVPVVITNSNNIIGPNQDPEKFVPKCIELIKADKKVSIHAIRGKSGRRHWNPVDNIASALLFISGLNPIKYDSFTDRPDRFSLGGGAELDNLAMAQLIAQLLNRVLHYELVNAEIYRPGYDSFYEAGGNELELLGWKPPVTDMVDGLAWIQ